MTISTCSPGCVPAPPPPPPSQRWSQPSRLSEQILDGVRILMSYISVCWDIFIVHISKYFIFQNISYFRIFPISEYFLFLISYDYDYLLSPISILYLILSHIYILDNILSKRSRDTARRTGADCHGLIVNYSLIAFTGNLWYFLP